MSRGGGGETERRLATRSSLENVTLDQLAAERVYRFAFGLLSADGP